MCGQELETNLDFWAKSEDGGTWFANRMKKHDPLFARCSCGFGVKVLGRMATRGVRLQKALDNAEKIYEALR